MLGTHVITMPTPNRFAVLTSVNVPPDTYRVNAIAHPEIVATLILVLLIATRLSDHEIQTRIKRISGLLADLANEIRALFAYLT